MRISDWSSDVCSSDLLLGPRDVLVIDEAGMIGTRQMECVLSHAEQAGAKVQSILAAASPMCSTLESNSALDSTGASRSEESRVGKECVSTCRSRLWPQH